MKEEKVVPFSEAVKQVQVAYSRLALLHLAYSKAIISEFGQDEGKDLILKGIMEYGRLIEGYSKQGEMNIPFYGLHEKYIYKNKELVDTRELFSLGDDLDLSELEIYGCILARIFKTMNEEDAGKLYCYVDASRSMANDPSTKDIHTKCVLCGDEYCQIETKITTAQEKVDFQESRKEWKNVDKILL